jgi:uroporphyrin-III C-methyltransferase
MGKVYLIGAGPGAPDLITLRAAKLLGEADIVFYDSLANAQLLALAAGAEKIAVGKRCGRHSTAQAFINKRLIDAARKHAVVVRLKGGDPMLFGRAQEEIDALAAAGIAVEVVPGVTAACAASAALGVSLTRRGASRSVAFVTPRVGPGERKTDWVATLLAADTAVVYMGAGEADTIANALMERGLPRTTPVAVVQNASLPGESCRVARLDQLATLAQTSDGPATIVIGEVLRERLAAARPDKIDSPLPVLLQQIS